MEIERVFTDGETPVYNMFKWKTVDVRITDQDGNAVFEMEGAEFPEHYSQQACDIIASKYFRVMDSEGNRESSMRDVANRMATFWTEALVDEELLDEEEAAAFYDEVVYALLAQFWAPNSPQWFNSGLGVMYDREANVSLYRDFSLEEPDDGRPLVRGIENVDPYAQTSACFITSVRDTLIGRDSITDHFVTETKLFKGGSGTGTNFSPVRACGECLTAGGTSSGVMSFLDALDRNAGTIKSGGTTRRAAKMVILDVDHPDILEFIDWKAHEERKARALIAAGYDGSMGGEAYATVSGQNGNNSVRLSREFMEKVMNLGNDPEATVTLRGRVDDSVNREVRVSEIWDALARAAWECADPGVQFDDTFNEWNTCPQSGRINATNPCSEFAFLDDSACNLASINVYGLWERYGKEDDGPFWDAYAHLVRLVQLVLEASVHWGAFPTGKIAVNSARFRPTGLGITNLASLLLAKRLPYDSDEARLLAGALACVLTGVSYGASHEMAEEIGAFPEYERNREGVRGVLEKHYREFLSHLGHMRKALDDIDPEDEKGWLNQSLTVGAMQMAWAWFEDGVLFPYVWGTAGVVSPGSAALGVGVRNAQVSVMAPTGTISFAMDCASTGIEPFYSHTTYKKCSDGSYMEIVNPLYDESLPADVLATANEISPEGHLRMMAAMQPFLSGAISKTVNMPNSATVEDVKGVYLMAYELGLKSVSIYRDGSKGVQPLTEKKADDEAESSPRVAPSEGAADIGALVAVPGTGRVRPEGIRNSRTHAAKIGDVELYVTVGYYPDGRLAEIFASSDKDGTVVKSLLASLSKGVSYMLQYGIEPSVIAKMLRNQKDETAGIVERHPYIKMADSISDLISRIIELEMGDYSRCQVKPASDGVPRPAGAAEETVRIWGERCPECGSGNLLQSGTCKTCADCGATTGCA